MAKKITKIEPVSKPYEPDSLPVKQVCAYCRVSTGSAVQKNSFDAQMDYYTQMIQERDGWVYAGIYADEARSATKTDRRDDFQRMLRDCRTGKIDLIITKSVTRFARNTVDSIRTIRELKALGIGVYFEKERVNTLSEKSEQLLTILSSIAQGESESISTNNKWSVVRRFQNGTFIISEPAYGYTNNEDGELVIQRSEARIIRRIFDEYLGGKGSYVIAKELRIEGIPTIRRAKEWQDCVVKGILRNCVYEGDLLLQKTFTMDGVPFIRKANHGELPQYLITDNHEPIITREEARAVKELCEYRRGVQCVEDLGAYQNRYAFSSRIVCGECGGGFRRQKIYIGKPYETIQWGCHRHIKDISNCKQKAVREDYIKQAFVKMWNRLASNYESILLPLLATIKAVQGDQEQERELRELEQKIQELKKQSHMLSKVLMGGGIGSAVFIEKRNQIDLELDTAWRRQQQIKEQKLFEQEILQTEYLITVLKNRPTIIAEYEEELFLMTIDQITVLKEKRLSFKLKNGLELEEFYGEKKVINE